MTRFLIAAFITLCTGASISAADAPSKPEPGGEKPKDPAFAQVKDDPALPRVLLIGDSISIGYTVPVRELLKGKANVHRNPGNGETTRNGVKMAEKWTADNKWDVIHFNFGLHDIKIMTEDNRQVPIDEYEKNLREVVAKLKKTNAKLIFATTTPVPEGKVSPTRHPEDVVKYNAVAVKIMKEEQVMVDDLYALTEPKLKEIQQKVNVHFTKEGSKLIAEKVAAAISEALPSRK